MLIWQTFDIFNVEHFHLLSTLIFFLLNFAVCLPFADIQGSDNPVPLSPQWLLPKPADNKLGILSGVKCHYFSIKFQLLKHSTGKCT